MKKYVAIVLKDAKQSIFTDILWGEDFLRLKFLPNIMSEFVDVEI